MATLDTAIEPELSASEREELSHLEYFRQRLEELRDRDLIAAGACETVLAEGRGSSRDDPPARAIPGHGRPGEAAGCKQASGRGL